MTGGGKKILQVALGLTIFVVLFLSISYKLDLAYRKVGIDVSKHNGNISWQNFKNAGVDFALLRTSFGWSDREKFTDPELKNNIVGAKSAGINIGAYHCSYATNLNEAEMEADFFIDRLKWTSWEYPVFIDMETRGQLNLNKEQVTDIALTFLNKVKAAGYLTGIYASLNWINEKIEIDRLSDHILWVAQWNEKCDCKTNYDIWQYTNSGEISGVSGKVDLNYSYKDFPTIVKTAHLNGF